MIHRGSSSVRTRTGFVSNPLRPYVTALTQVLRMVFVLQVDLSDGVAVVDGRHRLACLPRSCPLLQVCPPHVSTAL